MSSGDNCGRSTLIVSLFSIDLPSPVLSQICLVVSRGQLAGDVLSLLGRQLFLTNLVGQLVDGAREFEWQLVALIHSSARIHPDVHRLVERHEKRNRMVDLLL